LVTELWWWAEYVNVLLNSPFLEYVKGWVSSVILEVMQHRWKVIKLK